MLRVATTQQIRKLESDFIASVNANWGVVLMELAGCGAAKIAFAMHQSDPGPAYIFCGTGNNGGDGLVIARYLKLWQVPVRVFLVAKAQTSSSGKPKALFDCMSSEESKNSYRLARSLEIPIDHIQDAAQVDLQPATLVVDALFGTGLDRPLDGIYKKTVECLNASGKQILAVDIPSGVNSDNGQIMGTAVKASKTVTFGYLKTGLLCHPGAGLAGDIRLIDIGLPALGAEKPLVSCTTVEQVSALLPERKENSHKGTFGTLLTIAGSLGMSGATVFSAESALRVGCGLCYLATPKSLIPALPTAEIIYHPLKETSSQSIHSDAIADLDDDLKRVSAVVLGPGMSTHKETVHFVQEFVAETLSRLNDLPVVIDADALNAISANSACISSSSHKFVLTPHPKELSRLLKISTEEIQSDRINMALQAAKRFGCVVVLKGSFTVIASPEGSVAINPTGNASMAKAGAGDVLSGIIGGLLAQGLNHLDAAIAGAYIHGRAGELASQSLGMSGVLARDISDFIPDALMSVADRLGSQLETHLLEANMPLREN
jgi:ADP-dependent NAD(P)H-hydrate dehydratase / NAD(P)H-hydrate epimerase